MGNGLETFDVGDAPKEGCQLSFWIHVDTRLDCALDWSIRLIAKYLYQERVN